jgi:hypothetical protein
MTNTTFSFSAGILSDSLFLSLTILFYSILFSSILFYSILFLSIILLLSYINYSPYCRYCYYHTIPLFANFISTATDLRHFSFFHPKEWYPILTNLTVPTMILINHFLTVKKPHIFFLIFFRVILPRIKVHGKCGQI